MVIACALYFRKCASKGVRWNSQTHLTPEHVFKRVLGYEAKMDLKCVCELRLKVSIKM